MSEFLKDRYGDLASVLDGNEEAREPKICNFINTVKASEMLHRHIHCGSKIAIHCDVDVDGIGSGYIMRTMLEKLGVMRNVGFLINEKKEHGIDQKHCDYFLNNKIGLMVILDSASNDLEFIRQMNCDVIVVDHHEILHSELVGNTLSGQYIIVSNMVDNVDTAELKGALESAGVDSSEVEPYKTDSAMSCGLVLYEFLRVYQKLYNLGNIVQDTMLYQWAGVTLLTDAIRLSTERNQYYMDKTVHSMGIEPCLSQIVKNVSAYRPRIDKTVINYSIAPRINKAIRAGASRVALDLVLNAPQRLIELDVYRAKQEEAINQALSLPVYGLIHPEEKRFALIDITGTGIEKSYCGVIASKLVSKTGLNTAVCIYNPAINKYEGSFRGRIGYCNYREKFESLYELDEGEAIFAQGHASAFGFKATGEQLNIIMQSINSVEPERGSKKFYLTAGELDDSEKGIHHIDDMLKFKKEQGLVRLSMANSKLSTEEEINIMVKRPANLEIEWFNENKKAGNCEILGIQCRVFGELTSDWIEIYLEFSKEITAYARNMQA